LPIHLLYALRSFAPYVREIQRLSEHGTPDIETSSDFRRTIDGDGPAIVEHDKERQQ
jgi:hypothetical protein